MAPPEEPERRETAGEPMPAAELTPAEPAPSVSVVLPTYQRRELVRRAAESVLAQTYRDFELIVVDDGSTDGTEKALAGLDSRLRFSWQPNRGVAAARNAGLRLARGPVVAFLDSDNRWLPWHLDVVVGALERHPQAVLACTCPRFRIEGSEGPEDARLVDLLPALLLENTLGYISCTAVRRAALSAVGGFDEQLRAFEDSDLWQRLATLGPFSLVRRRTIVRQPTRDSLRQHARGSGGYLDAFSVSAASALAAIERIPDAGARGLLDWARGNVELAAGLRALAELDETAAAAALGRACALAPALSSDPRFVVVRLLLSTDDRAEVRRWVATAAAAWPDPRSDTALFLRAYGVALNLGAGRLREAARLAVARPLLLRPGFMLRSWRTTRRLLRSWAKGIVGRDPEFPLREAASPPAASVPSPPEAGSR